MHKLGEMGNSCRLLPWSPMNSQCQLEALGGFPFCDMLEAGTSLLFSEIADTVHTIL